MFYAINNCTKKYKATWLPQVCMWEMATSSETVDELEAPNIPFTFAESNSPRPQVTEL